MSFLARKTVKNEKIFETVIYYGKRFEWLCRLSLACVHLNWFTNWLIDWCGIKLECVSESRISLIIISLFANAHCQSHIETSTNLVAQFKTNSFIYGPWHYRIPSKHFSHDIWLSSTHFIGYQPHGQLSSFHLSLALFFMKIEAIDLGMTIWMLIYCSSF